MKKEMAVSIVLTFLLFLYAGVDPVEVVFTETYKAFNPFVSEQFYNTPGLTLFGIVWDLLPFLFFLAGTFILIKAVITLAESVTS